MDISELGAIGEIVGALDFLDHQYLNDSFKKRTIRLAPVWRALIVTGGRRSFLDEIERLKQLADKRC